MRSAAGRDGSTDVKASGPSTPLGAAGQGVGLTSGPSPSVDQGGQRQLALFEHSVIPTQLVLDLLGSTLDADRSLGFGDAGEAFTSGTLLGSSVSGRTFANSNADFSVLAGGRKDMDVWSSGAPYTAGGFDDSNLRGTRLIDAMIVDDAAGATIDAKLDAFKIDFFIATYGARLFGGLVLVTAALIALIGAQRLRKRRSED